MKKIIRYLIIFILLLISSVVLFACGTTEDENQPIELSAPTNLRIENKTLMWNVVNNASGYIVSIGLN